MGNWVPRRLIVLLVHFVLFIIFLCVIPQSGYAQSTITITSHQNGDVIPIGVTRIIGSYTQVSDLDVIINGMGEYKAEMLPESTEKGEWFYDLDTTTLDGDIEIVVKGTSTMTRYSAWSEPLMLSVDNKKANLPTVSILTPQSDTTLTKNTKVTVDASGKNNIEAVSIRVNGEEWLPTKKQNGVYSYHLTLPSERDLTYSIEAKAVDSEGNTGVSRTVYARTGNGRLVHTKVEKQDRAMWIWENASYNLIYNEGSRHVLEAFAKDTSTFNQDAITTLYLGVDRYYGVDMLEDERERVGDFVSWAHKQGFAVHALIAGGTKPPHFGAFEQYHDTAIREVETIINYNLASNQDEQFDGINIDIEPYIASEFKTEAPSLQIQYLDLLEKIMHLKQSADSSLFIGAAIPNWYDSSPYAENITWGPRLEKGKEETKWLSEHIQDLLDYISIMDYRDFAEGSNGMIEKARGEMEYAESIHKPYSVVIGAETKDIADGGDPELITFREEGRTYMEEELTKVSEAMNGYSSYGGIALHHYDTIRELPSEWSEYGVLWRAPPDTEAPSEVERQPNATAESYQSIVIDYGRAYDNSEIEHYRVYRGKTRDFTPGDNFIAGTSRGLSFVDKGLLSDTTYYYKVAAVDVNGNQGPISSVTSATTSTTSLKPLAIKEASISYSDGKGHMNLTVIDSSTADPIVATIRGRYEYMSGKVVSGKTDEEGTITFSSEMLPSENGKIGFKINAIIADGYYWASSLDSPTELVTTWSYDIFIPKQDTYIRSDSYGDNNYGNERLLEVKGVEESILNYNRQSLIQFKEEKAFLSDANSLILKFYVDRDVGDSQVSSVPISIYGAVNQEWNEEDLTWNTRPDADQFEYLGGVLVSGKGWYQFDLTEWGQGFADVDSATFRLSDDQRSDRLVPIHSKENTYAPSLEIHR